MSTMNILALEDHIDLYALGEKLCHWHVSMGDPIYAVGSYANIGKVHPDREVVEAARDSVERLFEKTPAGDDADELVECRDDLNILLAHWPAPEES